MKVILWFVVVAVAVGIGFLLLRSKFTPQEMTVGKGLEIAQNLSFYIPEGYSVNYRAKMVKTESGGDIV